MSNEDNLPAITGQSNLPADIAGLVEQDAGKGVSTRAEDNLVPLIYMLQDNSPQVKERDDDYITGAKPGDIWLRASLDPIVKGEEGFWAQPCAFYVDFVEWVPRKRGGGFVERHTAMPTDAVSTEDPENPNRVTFVRPNGNEVRETRYHVVNVHGRGGIQPYVIPLSGTGHTFSRQWMFIMNGVEVNGKKAPSFARLYKLGSKAKSNAAGDWFTWQILDSKWVETTEQYTAGRSLNLSFEAGEKKAAVDDGVAADPVDPNAAPF